MQEGRWTGRKEGGRLLARARLSEQAVAERPQPQVEKWQVAAIMQGGLVAACEGAGESPRGRALEGMDGQVEERVWSRQRKMPTYSARAQ
eukprot:2311837-Pyramimonas_sp.AAC.1